MNQLEPIFDDASHIFGRAMPLHADEARVLRAVQANPEDENSWVKLTSWLNDNGHQDEAEAVSAFWPAIADSIRCGMPFGRAMRLLAKHAPGLSRLAKRMVH